MSRQRSAVALAAVLFGTGACSAALAAELTVRLSDIATGIDSADPRELTAVGDGAFLYFSADDGERGRELWRFDGRSGDVVRVRDINRSPSSDGSDPRELTAVGAFLYFSADDGEHGRELWRSDGSDGGTEMVSDINDGAAGADPRELTAVGDGDFLFFSADDGERGRELWRSDGRAGVGGAVAGDVERLTDIADDAPGSDPEPLAAVGDALYFSADDGEHGRELWRIADLVAGGNAEQIADIHPAGDGLALTGDADAVDDAPEPRQAAALGGVLYFVADDGEHGRELWRSDGSRSGTEMVSDINDGAAGSDPRELTVIGDYLYFSADDGEHGRELWRSDGSDGGTEPVEDIRRGETGADPLGLTVAGDHLYFSADDGRRGRELWRTVLPRVRPSLEAMTLAPGSEGAVRYTLNTAPSSPVRLFLDSDDDACRLSSDRLTLDSDRQTGVAVVVSAAAGAAAGTCTLSATVSSIDRDFDGLPVAPVTIAIDDAPGPLFSDGFEN